MVDGGIHAQLLQGCYSSGFELVALGATAPQHLDTRTFGMAIAGFGELQLVDWTKTLRGFLLSKI